MFDEVRDLYNSAIIERARRPHHMRRLESFDATARGDNPMCGDRVQVWVRRDAQGRIADTGFEARGCDISKAAADLMVDAVAGHDADATRHLFAAFRTLVQTGDCPACAGALDALRPLAGVHEYPSRIKCATLPWHALIAALDGKGESSSE
jgi:nitrogen fixation NifU-like protein